MEENFAGVNLIDLGFKVQFVSGILDMPDRNGDTFYDWGDGFEPLVSAENIYFGSRNIVLQCFFDNRLADYKTSSQELETITTNQTLVTAYGNYTVRLDSIEITEKYKQGLSVKITFVELNPNLAGSLPTKSDSSGVSIDEYDLFTSFGLLVEEVIGFEIPSLNSSNETTYKTNALSKFREPPTVNVKVNGIYANKTDMTASIKSLNHILALPGLRHFSHNGTGYQC